MKYIEIEGTFISQLAKDQNRAMLEAYRDRDDKSPEEFSRYYKDIINALKDTPAWGVSGVNKMINQLTDSVRATLTCAKSGKTSAPAHAKLMLRYIDHFGNREVSGGGGTRHKLNPIITEEEFQQLLKGVAA